MGLSSLVSMNVAKLVMSWDAMDRLGEGELRKIETRLSRRMVTEFGLDLSGLSLARVGGA